MRSLDLTLSEKGEINEKQPTIDKVKKHTFISHFLFFIVDPRFSQD